MLSAKLIQLIESHWEEIAARLIHAIRTNPNTVALASRPDSELREWCGRILANLGALLIGTKDEEVRARAHIRSKQRFEESIPLHEAVLRFQILHQKIIGFVHEQGFPMSSLHLYAEEELELRISQLFDSMVYGLVRGYEEALRQKQSISSARD